MVSRFTPHQSHVSCQNVPEQDVELGEGEASKRDGLEKLGWM